MVEEVLEKGRLGVEGEKDCFGEVKASPPSIQYLPFYPHPPTFLYTCMYQLPPSTVPSTRKSTLMSTTAAGMRTKNHLRHINHFILSLLSFSIF